MDFKDTIRQLGERVARLKDQTLTEEATKHAFILPFLQALGYDVFDPMEIVPEFVTDVGTKKGEKVDFAVMKGGTPVILIEAKHWKQNLDNHDGQLLRYFHVCKASFSILTNGIEYRFFTDLVQPNIMDDSPFLEIDITTITDSQIEELKKFHKSYFDISVITSSASELKYTAALRALVTSEFKSPGETFVKYFATKVYNGRLTDKMLAYFSDLMRRSLQNMLSEMVSDRLKSALDKEQESMQPVIVPIDQEMTNKEPAVITTPEEMEGYYIIKSILRQAIDPNRITFRDAQSYMAILLDDNNRKTICRLYFNTSKKYLATLGTDKKENKVEIKDLDEIYLHSDVLKAAISSFIESKA